MHKANKLYLKKLRDWLVTGERYILSFPQSRTTTITRMNLGDIPNPDTDPVGAYKELTQRLRSPIPVNVSLDAIMGTIDHSLLTTTLSDEDLEKGYGVAKNYRVASVCTNNDAISAPLEALADTGIAGGAVISFPSGKDATKIKVYAAKQALKNGATEIDMPINVGKMLSRDYDYVYKDLKAVWKVVRKKGAIFKPIAKVDDLDNSWRKSDDYVEGGHNPLIVEYCRMVNRLQRELPGGFHQLMVKTSTGFDYQKDKDDKLGYLGATIPGVLNTFAVFYPYGSPIGIKAAGKIGTAEQFLNIMKNFGVVRIGCTATEKVARELLEMGYKSYYPSKV